MKLSAIGVVLLSACAANGLSVATLAPTLDITNATDDQLTLYYDDDGAAMARVGPMGHACIVLRNLPTGAVVLGFRPLSRRVMRAFPEDYTRSAGWSLLVTSASHDGGFFASPAPRCR